MSHLEAKLTAGEFVVTAEMPTIDGGGYAEIQRQLAPMKAWVDAVNATDNPAAHAHASPLAVAIALKDCGVEPVMQLACRDRNRLNLQAAAGGAAMECRSNTSWFRRSAASRRAPADGPPIFDPCRWQLIAV